MNQDKAAPDKPHDSRDLPGVFYGTRQTFGKHHRLG